MSHLRAKFLAIALAAVSAAACTETHGERRAVDAGEQPSDDAGKPARAQMSSGSGGAGGMKPSSAAGNGSSGSEGAGSGGAAGSSGADAGSAGTAASAHQPCEKNADNASDVLELVSLSTECTASDGDAAFSRLTPDGRYLVFESSADDLVPDDLNGGDDIFFFDLDTRSLELISKKYGADAPARGNSFTPVLSDDARYVAFTALSYELTSPMPSEGLWVYLRDRRTGTTRRLPADYVCAYWVDMSGDGAFIVAEGYTRCDGGLDDGDFDSAVEYDTAKDSMRHLGVQDGGDNYRPAISRDGRFIVWAIRPAMTRGSQTSQLQIFDRETDTTETLPFMAFHYSSLDVSDAGDVIAFSQNRQVYRYDRSADELTLVTKNAAGEVGDDWSDEVSLSGDGRYLVFETDATNLVEGDTNGAGDILLYDAATQSLERLSVAPDGAEADGESAHPHISGNGARVSFASKARNLLPAATSGDYQLYVRSLEPE